MLCQCAVGRLDDLKIGVYASSDGTDRGPERSGREVQSASRELLDHKLGDGWETVLRRSVVTASAEMMARPKAIS